MSRRLLKKAAIVTGGAAVGAGIVCLGVPAAVGLLGFGSLGIKAGSIAAWMMSLFGGATQAGGIVAVCQSIGTAGVATSAVVGGSVAGGITGLIASRNDEGEQNEEDEEEDS